MKDYYDYYINYFKEYEENMEDKVFFREEINYILNYIYEEIEYSKKYIRFKDNGIESNFDNDLNSFISNTNKYKEAFIGKDIQIKYPQRLSSIFAYQYNYLRNEFKIKEKDINTIFEDIREEIFSIKKAPSLVKEQKKIDISVINYMERFLTELRNEYPTLTDDEILNKVFTKKSK
ncbi:MAG: hypothetical protein PHG81_03040 [Aliarcobacter sp.]|nr:hypothetical protein [Aliarcobacter sp.]